MTQENYNKAKELDKKICHLKNTLNDIDLLMQDKPKKDILTRVSIYVPAPSCKYYPVFDLEDLDPRYNNLQLIIDTIKTRIRDLEIEFETI